MEHCGHLVVAENGNPEGVILTGRLYLLSKINCVIFIVINGKMICNNITSQRFIYILVVEMFYFRHCG